MTKEQVQVTRTETRLPLLPGQARIDIREHGAERGLIVGGSATAARAARAAAAERHERGMPERHVEHDPRLVAAIVDGVKVPGGGRR